MVRAEVMHPAEPLQRAAAHALAHLVARDGQDPAVVLDALQDTYHSKLPVSRVENQIFHVPRFQILLYLFMDDLSLLDS